MSDTTKAIEVPGCDGFTLTEHDEGGTPVVHHLGVTCPFAAGFGYEGDHGERIQTKFYETPVGVLRRTAVRKDHVVDQTERITVTWDLVTLEKCKDFGDAVVDATEMVKNTSYDVQVARDLLNNMLGDWEHEPFADLHRALTRFEEAEHALDEAHRTLEAAVRAKAKAKE